MESEINSRKQDLYERCLKFGKEIRVFVKKLPKTVVNIEDGKQVVRSSGSIGANYIEAWDMISEKDELHRLRVCRKEAKESRHWLELISCADLDGDLEKERQRLSQEALELTKIFGSIVGKKEKPPSDPDSSTKK